MGERDARPAQGRTGRPWPARCRRPSRERPEGALPSPPVPLRSAPMCRAVTNRVVAGRDRMPDRLRTTGPCQSATPLADASPHHQPDPAVRGSHLGRPCRSVHAASRARGLRSAAGSASARSRAGRVATLRLIARLASLSSGVRARPRRVAGQWPPNALMPGLPTRPLTKISAPCPLLRKLSAAPAVSDGAGLTKISAGGRACRGLEGRQAPSPVTDGVRHADFCQRTVGER